jgi:metal-responsive CopG/Arc/MetJ family transcriptional regulator
MSEKKTERKNVFFPVDLLKRISEVKEDTDFSSFIRDAAKEKVEKIEREKLKKRLEEGYKAKAELNKKTSEDFKYVDGENL